MTKIRPSPPASDTIIIAPQREEEAPAAPIFRPRCKASPPAYDYVKLAKVAAGAFVAIGTLAAPVIYYAYFRQNPPPGPPPNPQPPVNPLPTPDPSIGETVEHWFNVAKGVGVIVAVLFGIFGNKGSPKPQEIILPPSGYKGPVPLSSTPWNTENPSENRATSGGETSSTIIFSPPKSSTTTFSTKNETSKKRTNRSKTKELPSERSHTKSAKSSGYSLNFPQNPIPKNLLNKVEEIHKRASELHKDSSEQVKKDLLGDISETIQSCLDFEEKTEDKYEAVKLIDDLTNINTRVNDFQGTSNIVLNHNLSVHSSSPLSLTVPNQENADIAAVKSTKSVRRNNHIEPTINLHESEELKAATKFVDGFDPKSIFSSGLWEFADNYPTQLILSESDYFDTKEVRKFLERLKANIQTLVDLTELISQHKIWQVEGVCVKLTKKLCEIELSAQKISDDTGNDEVLMQKLLENFNADFLETLKMDFQLTTELKMELESYERTTLLKFFDSLSLLTLEGYNKNSKKIAEGLEKLRQYITERRPRLREPMRFGVQYYAQPIYNFCLDSFFSNNKERDEILNGMCDDSDDGVAVACLTHSSGKKCTANESSSGHWTCIVRTEKDNVTLDNLDRRKIPNASFPERRDCEQSDKSVASKDAIEINVQSEAHLILNKPFFESCKAPLNLEKISIPTWQANNCYLASGWLKFCVFLHYLKQHHV